MVIRSTDYSFNAPPPIGEHEYMKLKQLFIVRPESEIPGPPRYFMHPEHKEERNILLGLLAIILILGPIVPKYKNTVIILILASSIGLFFTWLIQHLFSEGFSYMSARSNAIAYNRRLKRAIIESPDYEYFRKSFYKK
jgi:hypothetical protein